MTTPTPPAVGDIWYRAIMYKHDSSVHYEKWYVHAVTPKGVWVGRCHPDVSFEALSHKESGRRWYSLSTRRISRTKEEALERLIRRTARWVTLERDRLATAEKRYAALTSGRIREATLLYIGLPFAYGVE